MTIFSKFKISVLDRSNSDEIPERKTPAERLQSFISPCLEKSRQAMILTDTQGEIVFMNQAIRTFMTEFVTDFRQFASAFNFNDPIGTSINALLPNFKQLPKGQPTQIDVGSRTFDLTIKPIGEQVDGYMIEFNDMTVRHNNTAILHAMDRSQAVIEFTPEGEILTANDNFLAAMGYQLNEIVGNHHSMFAPSELKGTHEYKVFWQELKRGDFKTGEMRRIKKDGREIWLSASYNPVFNQSGEVVKVIKFATDITQQKQLNIDFEGQMKAVHANQAVIEFDMDGTIRTANDAFLQATGYQLSEIQGKHHKIFATREYASSPEYAKLWSDLNDGVAFVDEIERVTKSGDKIWLSASYNPIVNTEGKPYKVVKFASDLTERKHLVDNIQNILKELSSGQLNTHLEVGEDSPFSEIADSMNQFISGFKQIIAQIVDSVEATKNSSAEIASGNSDLSTRTEQQASALEETSSSMEELATSIKGTSDQSNSANTMAQNASKIAQNGGELIEHVVKNMSSITESADKISEIIGVIDGIAFQTNILALNAAVEAARAGEQGKGFAVVAAEVRTLAQRSANAAKDIKSLISDSVERIQSGNKLVSDSGETMNQIVSSIKEVTNTMSVIDNNLSQQYSSIEEVTTAIKNMDAMTQQNSALVEEVAAASENMQQQAVALSGTVSRYSF